MDIAKIRKKAKEQEVAKSAEDRAVPREAAEETLPLPETEPEVKAEIQEQIIPEEVQTPRHETIMKEASAQKPTGAISQEEDHARAELLTFRLGREEYAFEVAEVEEIIRLQKMTKVPTVQNYIIGITSLRGKIIPVIDLKARLHLRDEGEVPEYGTQEDPGGSRESKILIIDGPRGFIGATIDRVMGVVSVPKNRVLEPPAHLNEAEIKYIRGIVVLEKRFISVLRAEDTMNIEIG